VDCMLREMGRRAVALAIEAAENETVRRGQRQCRELIPGELVVRESTAPPSN
jgi:DNA-binding LacI/PurR family transcriptional regulator